MKTLATTLSTAALLASCALAADYSFTNDGGDIQDPANWNPTPPPGPWAPADTGTVAKATAMIRSWSGDVNYPQGPAFILEEGGVVIVPGDWTATSEIFMPFVFNGGRLEIQRGFFTSRGAMRIENPSAITLGGTYTNMDGDITGGGALTLNGLWDNPSSLSGEGMNWDKGPRFNGSNAGFTGDVLLKTRVYLTGDNQLGTGTLTVGENGILDILHGSYRDITLDGGALRGNNIYWGNLTLASDSVIDSDYWQRFYVNNISGTGDITVGKYFDHGGWGGGGRVVFFGDNTGWDGDVYFNNVKPLWDFSEFRYPVSLPGGGSGAINALNSGVFLLLLDQGSGWKLSNNLNGNFYIKVNNGGGTFTISGGDVAPGLPNAAGSMQFEGNLTLTDGATFKMKQLAANNHDWIHVYGTLDLDDANLECAATYDGDDTDVLFLIASYARVGFFNGLPEGAEVTLCENPRRTAKITYEASAGNKALTGGNDVALYDFTTAALPEPPTVELNGGATGILAYSATLNGLVTAGVPMPEVFFVWGGKDYGNVTTNAWPNIVPMGKKDGAFSTTLKNLPGDSNLVYRCFAVNSEGEGWSDPGAFKTLPPQFMYWTRPHPGNLATHDGPQNGWHQAHHWDGGIVPSSSGDTGYITNGMWACADGNLGTAGDRPTIVVTAGGELYSLSAPSDTPIVLDGGTLDLNWRNSNFKNLRVTSDSKINSGNGNPDHRIVSQISVDASATLTVGGGMLSFDGDNPGFLGNLRLDAGNYHLHNPLALGSASVFLMDGAVAGGGWHDWALSFSNPAVGFGSLKSTHANGVTLNNSVTPGDGETPGILFVDAPSKLVLASTASLDINLWNADNHGRLEANSAVIDLTANPSLNLNIKEGFKARVGDAFVLLRNTGGNAIDGGFLDLEEGAKIKLGSVASGTLTYEYEGNNIAITNIRLGGTLLLVK